MTTEARTPWHEFVGPVGQSRLGGPVGTAPKTLLPPLSTSRRQTLWSVSLLLLGALLLAVGLLLSFVMVASPARATDLCPSPDPSATATPTPTGSPSPCVTAFPVTLTPDSEVSQVVIYGVSLSVLLSGAALVSSWGRGSHG